MVLWSKLRHPNIAPLLGITTHPGFEGFLMVSLWMENGNLPNYLENEWNDASFVEYRHEVNRIVSLGSLQPVFLTSKDFLTAISSR